MGFLVLGLSACATTSVATEGQGEIPGATSEGSQMPSPSPPQSPAASPDPPTPTAKRDAAGPDREPAVLRASMRIPAIGLRAVPIVPYRGSPDDGPGTSIQDGGVAASPFGPRGGVGPGQVGNYIVTAHRTTTPAPFADLPSMRRGEHVLIEAGGGSSTTG